MEKEKRLSIVAFLKVSEEREAFDLYNLQDIDL
jgi:hypothetical protein